MTLSRPSQNTSFSPNAQPVPKRKTVRFAIPEVQEPGSPLSRSLSPLLDPPDPPPTPEPQPATWFQQFWEDFKLTNWWAVFVFTELFKGSAPPS